MGMKALPHSLLQVAVSERAVCTYFLSYRNSSYSYALDFFPLHILQIFVVVVVLDGGKVFVLFCFSPSAFLFESEILPGS